MQVTVGALHQRIAQYNKFRENHQGVTFTTAELKTEFEKIGIPFNYHYMPFYMQFQLIIRQARNKYTLPSRVVYKARLANAWEFTTKKRRLEYKHAA